MTISDRHAESDKPAATTNALSWVEDTAKDVWSGFTGAAFDSVSTPSGLLHTGLKVGIAAGVGFVAARMFPAATGAGLLLQATMVPTLANLADANDMLAGAGAGESNWAQQSGRMLFDTLLTGGASTAGTFGVRMAAGRALDGLQTKLAAAELDPGANLIPLRQQILEKSNLAYGTLDMRTATAAHELGREFVAVGDTQGAMWGGSAGKTIQAFNDRIPAPGFATSFSPMSRLETQRSLQSTFKSLIDRPAPQSAWRAQPRYADAAEYARNVTPGQPAIGNTLLLS